MGTAMALVVTHGGAAQIVCSLRRGWSGRAGLGVTTAGGREAESGGFPEKAGDGGRNPWTWGRTGLLTTRLGAKDPASPPTNAPGPGRLIHC